MQPLQGGVRLRVMPSPMGLDGVCGRAFDYARQLIG
jgi:hypothetical protein